MFEHDDHIVYTRYLYNYIEVRQSLFISLLNHDIEETLYWAYELYYSGFKYQTLEYITDIYLLIYRNDNLFMESDLLNSIEKLKLSDDPLAFGNLFASLCTRNYDLQKFCKKYLHVDVLQMNKDIQNRLIIQLTDEYIKTYETIEPGMPAYRVLRNAVKYPLRKNINKLFNILIPEYDDLYRIFNNHWLYYAYRCPLWKERIEECNGTIIDNCVVFPEEDDEIEKFYEKWGYDPDEQPAIVKQKCIGNTETLQMNIKDFCKQYHLQIKLKKIISNVKTHDCT